MKTKSAVATLSGAPAQDKWDEICKATQPHFDALGRKNPSAGERLRVFDQPYPPSPAPTQRSPLADFEGDVRGISEYSREELIAEVEKLQAAPTQRSGEVEELRKALELAAWHMDNNIPDEKKTETWWEERNKISEALNEPSA